MPKNVTTFRDYRRTRTYNFILGVQNVSRYNFVFIKDNDTFLSLQCLCLIDFALTVNQNNIFFFFTESCIEHCLHGLGPSLQILKPSPDIGI